MDGPTIASEPSRDTHDHVKSRLEPKMESRQLHRTYRGHRRASFIEDDVDELIELRARQRTFGGAYERSALGNLGYALLVLKIFNPDFAKIGLLYVILSILLLLIAQYRRRRSDHDFADINKPESTLTSEDLPKAAERVWGRAFRTSGDMVVLISLTCTALYVAMFVLVLKLPD
ncbi:hypothetical protein JCM5353_001618 [Sporobolomyces roseus]